jgi:hypothetical protein
MDTLAIMDELLLMDVIKERNQIIWRLLLIMAEPIEK